MKNTFILLFLMCILSISKAQIALEYTFEDWEQRPYPNLYSVFETTREDSKLVKFIFKRPEYKLLTIYNLDHSVYREIDLSQLADFDQDYLGIKIYFASKYLFSEDEKIEFLAQFKSASNSGVEVLRSVILNEDGDILFDFGPRFQFHSSFPDDNRVEILSTAVGYKLKMFNYVSDNVVNIEIYSLGKESTLTALKDRVLEEYAYPNPANLTITIPLSNTPSSSVLRIFNIKGELVEQKLIKPNTKEIKLNISAYSSGVYISEQGNQKQKFIVN